jgi:hypothetical protein
MAVLGGFAAEWCASRLAILAPHNEPRDKGTDYDSGGEEYRGCGDESDDHRGLVLVAPYFVRSVFLRRFVFFH